MKIFVDSTKHFSGCRTSRQTFPAETLVIFPANVTKQAFTEQISVMLQILNCSLSLGLLVLGGYYLWIALYQRVRVCEAIFRCSVSSNIHKNFQCGTYATFSYPALQLKRILLPALHSYLDFIFNALQLNELPIFMFIFYIL